MATIAPECRQRTTVRDCTIASARRSDVVRSSDGSDDEGDARMGALTNPLRRARKSAELSTPDVFNAIEDIRRITASGRSSVDPSGSCAKATNTPCPLGTNRRHAA